MDIWKWDFHFDGNTETEENHQVITKQNPTKVPTGNVETNF